MMKKRTSGSMGVWRVVGLQLCLWGGAALVSAQSAAPEVETTLRNRLTVSVNQLATLRQQIAEEQIPMSRQLSALEQELREAREAYEQARRRLDGRNLDLGNLRQEIKEREQEGTYLSNLLDEYVRNFETRLHIAELRQYREQIEAAREAPGQGVLSPDEIYARQTGLMLKSVSRLERLAGGQWLEGAAAGEDGLVRRGTFLLLGPSAYFLPVEGGPAGLAEQRLGSLEPALIPFNQPEHAALLTRLFEQQAGELPFDASLGNARKIEETRQTLWEHIQKGGVVMVPILGMALAAFLLGMVKWVELTRVPMPSDRQVEPVLQAASLNRQAVAFLALDELKGPAAAMLRAGVSYLNHGRELVEEGMYEVMLATRLKLQRGLPFIAVCASCAPLLGLLGTVTGIINTFKLITVFGSGDVKMLSGGISEALITTEFGLIIAIPALLLHAFLSRRAKALSDRMEKMAITFMNQTATVRVDGVRADG